MVCPRSCGSGGGECGLWSHSVKLLFLAGTPVVLGHQHMLLVAGSALAIPAGSADGARAHDWLSA